MLVSQFLIHLMCATLLSYYSAFFVKMSNASQKSNSAPSRLSPSSTKLGTSSKQTASGFDEPRSAWPCADWQGWCVLPSFSCYQSGSEPVPHRCPWMAPGRWSCPWGSAAALSHALGLSRGCSPRCTPGEPQRPLSLRHGAPRGTREQSTGAQPLASVFGVRRSRSTVARTGLLQPCPLRLPLSPIAAVSQQKGADAALGSRRTRCWKGLLRVQDPRGFQLCSTSSLSAVLPTALGTAGPARPMGTWL